MTKAHRAECFPVWDYIEEEMDARQWNRMDLARNMGGNIDVNLIVLDFLEYMPDETRVTLEDETANKLGKAFGTGPELWLNLHTAYMAWLKAKPALATLPKGGE